jgi:hypothetical protein
VVHGRGAGLICIVVHGRGEWWGCNVVQGDEYGRAVIWFRSGAGSILWCMDEECGGAIMWCRVMSVVGLYVMWCMVQEQGWIHIVVHGR